MYLQTESLSFDCDSETTVSAQQNWSCNTVFSWPLNCPELLVKLWAFVSWTKTRENTQTCPLPFTAAFLQQTSPKRLHINVQALRKPCMSSQVVLKWTQQGTNLIKWLLSPVSNKPDAPSTQQEQRMNAGVCSASHMHFCTFLSVVTRSCPSIKSLYSWPASIDFAWQKHSWVVSKSYMSPVYINLIYSSSSKSRKLGKCMSKEL